MAKSNFEKVESVVSWVRDKKITGVFGVILGAIVAWIVVGASALVRRVRGKA